MMRMVFVIQDTSKVSCDRPPEFLRHVFDSVQLAQRYMAHFGKPGWELVSVPVMSQVMVDALIGDKKARERNVLEIGPGT